MATCLNKLDLTQLDDRALEVYKKLMSASTEQDSVYIKAKETLTAVMEASNIDDREKAQILAQTISGMVTSITAQSMQTAVDMAKDERDAPYTLAKICADTDLTQAQKDKLAADTANVEQDTNLRIAQGWKVQGEMYRDFGAIPDQLSYSKPVLSNVDYTSTYGLKHETITKAQADRYVTYANSYRTSGKVDYSVDAEGKFDVVSADTSGLTNAQTGVALRQIQGFDDNQRQHVVNSSASMIGLLLSTDIGGIDYAPYLEQWLDASSYLSTSHSPSTGISGAVDVLVEGTISVASGHTMSGNTTGIQAGRTVAVKYTAVDQTTVYGTPGLVMLDGTWESVLPANKSADLVAGVEYTVTVSIVDGTGTTVYDTFVQTVTA